MTCKNDQGWVAYETGAEFVPCDDIAPTAAEAVRRFLASSCVGADFDLWKVRRTTWGDWWDCLPMLCPMLIESWEDELEEASILATGDAITDFISCADAAQLTKRLRYGFEQFMLGKYGKPKRFIVEKETRHYTKVDVVEGGTPDE